MQTEVALQAVRVGFLPPEPLLGVTHYKYSCSDLPSLGLGPANSAEPHWGLLFPAAPVCEQPHSHFAKGQSFHFLLQTIIVVSLEDAWC